MIDFRYHIVSIVAVFFALAVGIALGAGPLKDEVGDTLTNEVQQLRQDRTDLRVDLDRATSVSEARDGYITATAPLVLANRLPGRSIAVVVAPGADSGVVSGVREALVAGGATVASTTTLEDSWLTQESTERTELATTLAPDLGITGEAPDGLLIDTVLARSLLGTTGALTQGSQGVLDALDDADLVSRDSNEAAPATAAVLVTGPITGDTQEDRDRRAEMLAGLATALDSSSNGAVLVDSTATDTDTSSAVQSLRSDSDQARAVSTVDDGELSMGQVSVVVALEEQVDGGSGQYGLADRADADFPPVTSSD